MSRIVDANVALAWVVPSDRSAAAGALLAADEMLIAPDLIVSELANALWRLARAGQLEPGRAPRLLEAALFCLDEIIPARAFAGRALALACELGHPAYDCVYLALAESRGGTMVTADLRLLGAVNGSAHERRISALAGPGSS